MKYEEITRGEGEHTEVIGARFPCPCGACQPLTVHFVGAGLGTREHRAIEPRKRFQEGFEGHVVSPCELHLTLREGQIVDVTPPAPEPPPVAAPTEPETAKPESAET